MQIPDGHGARSPGARRPNRHSASHSLPGRPSRGRRGKPASDPPPGFEARRLAAVGRGSWLNVLIEHSPEAVWEVLGDGWAYAEWVAGTRNIRDVDARWPEPGARIHYTSGVGRHRSRSLGVAQPS